MSIFSRFFKNTKTVGTSPKASSCPHSSGSLQVDDFFMIQSKGLVLTGKIISGGLCTGFASEKDGKKIEIREMEIKNQQVESAGTNEEVGVLVDKNLKGLVKKGDVLEFKNK